MGRPSVSIVSEDAGIEPMPALATFLTTVRRSNYRGRDLTTGDTVIYRSWSLCPCRDGYIAFTAC
jgi:hypothetical protein